MRLRKIEEHITVTTFVHNSASEVAKFSKPTKETREKICCHFLLAKREKVPKFYAKALNRKRCETTTTAKIRSNTK